MKLPKLCVYVGVGRGQRSTSGMDFEDTIHFFSFSLSQHLSLAQNLPCRLGSLVSEHQGSMSPPTMAHTVLGLHMYTATRDISLTWVAGTELRSITGEVLTVTITDEILASKAKTSEVRMNLTAD